MWASPCLSPEVMCVPSAHISLARTSQMAPPDSRGAWNIINKDIKYLVNIMVSATDTVVTRLLVCLIHWTLNFSRAEAVSTLLLCPKHKGTQ